MFPYIALFQRGLFCDGGSSVSGLWYTDQIFPGSGYDSYSVVLCYIGAYSWYIVSDGLWSIGVFQGTIQKLCIYNV